LICGVGGQDGAYLARFLIAKGYEVVGTSRDAANAAVAEGTVDFAAIARSRVNGR